MKDFAMVISVIGVVICGVFALQRFAYDIITMYLFGM